VSLRRGVIACALTLGLVPATARAADLAFVWFGEPDPSGVDQAFLALGRRRGAPSLRESPGRLGDEPLAGRLARAVAAAQALDLKGALAGFDEVEREVVARGGADLSEGELVDLYTSRAGAHAAMGDEGDAWSDLVQAAVLAPTRPLDPARFPPRLVEAARRAAQAAAMTRARLAVSVQPDDASIIVDGQLLGRGRVELTLPAGRHFVRGERAGFVAAARVVAIGEAGGEVRLTLAAATAPTAAELARRGALAASARTLGAFVSARDGRPELTLMLVGGKGTVEGRRALAADATLTTATLAAAVDALLGDEAARAAVATSAPPPPWWRRAWVWGVAGGVAGATAIAVGLGVGLGTRGHGTDVHVDLGPAR
jgi:hypothetical protein